VDAKTLSGILGHTNASFTLDTYTHTTGDMQKRASEMGKTIDFYRYVFFCGRALGQKGRYHKFESLILTVINRAGNANYGSFEGFSITF